MPACVAAFCGRANCVPPGCVPAGVAAGTAPAGCSTTTPGIANAATPAIDPAVTWPADGSLARRSRPAAAQIERQARWTMTTTSNTHTVTTIEPINPATAVRGCSIHAEIFAVLGREGCSALIHSTVASGGPAT